MEVTFKWQEQSHGGWQPRRKTVKTTGDKTVLGLAREQDIKIEAMCPNVNEHFVHGQVFNCVKTLHTKDTYSAIGEIAAIANEGKG